MAIYPGGGPSKSTAVNSPRHLTIRNTRRLVKERKLALGLPSSLHEAAALAVARVRNNVEPEDTRNVGLFTVAATGDEDHSSDVESDVDDTLQPGQEKLYSYWAPGLKAGQDHHINIVQTIDSHKDGAMTLKSDKRFSVDAPQFSLPGDAVHSVYPPPGYHEDARILPHIVLTDPHMPWEREGDVAIPGARTQVPWLILVSFMHDELAISSVNLNGDAGIFADKQIDIQRPVQQSSTMTVNMTAADLLKTDPTRIASPLRGDGAPTFVSSDRGDFVFLQPDTFLTLFSDFDNNGVRQVPKTPNTNQYALLAHVRHVHAAGMALAGVEDSAVFSMVIGSRAGPVDISTPATMSVHLLSIEGVNKMSTTFPTGTQYVALSSLYSWNYVVNPPGRTDVHDSFKSLGKTLDMLRPPESVLEPLRPKTGETRTKEQARVLARLEDGYSLVKHHLQTGEQTVAFFRGPFVPTDVGAMAPIHDRCSNSGTDLQTLDPVVGIMDITYSSAWQLGRVLALGDVAFTTALGRHRTEIHQPAMKESKTDSIRSIDALAYMSKHDVLHSLPDLVRGLADIQKLDRVPAGDPEELDDAPIIPMSTLNLGQAVAPTDNTVEDAGFNPADPRQRWFRPRLSRSEFPSLAFSAPLVAERYPAAAAMAAERLAASTEGGPHDETNEPVSSNWTVVMNWLLGKMFLDGVPAHYLITDPSHLPEESLRFFHIDPNWVDALLDGALSLGNHRGRDEDRVAIKKALQTYLSSKPKHTDLTPQIPSYGFLLRSDLVSRFPDLRVTTVGELPEDRAPLLRHSIISDGVMLGLLDRVPHEKGWTGLVLTQPPHQQRYAVGDDLTKDGLTINIRRQYTVDPAVRLADSLRHETLLPVIANKPPSSTAGSPGPNDNLFIWGTSHGLNNVRRLRLPQFAERQLAILRGPWPSDQDKEKHPSGGELSSSGKRYFDDDTPTSALLAMQLSDPVYSLTISLSTVTSPEKPTALFLSRARPTATTGLSGPRLLTGLLPPLVPELVAPPGNELAVPARAQSGANPRSPERQGDPVEGGQSSLKPPATRNGDIHLIAPHIRRIHTTTPSAPQAVMSNDDEGAAKMPRFEIKLYTRGNTDTSRIFIPRDPVQQLRQDIIFSVQARDNRDGETWKLTELTMTIPLGPAGDDSDSSDYLLTDNYAGPGATILRNLRFNVLVSRYKVENVSYLQLRLLPRAKKGFIPIDYVTDISCMLALVDVNRWDGHVPGQEAVPPPSPPSDGGGGESGTGSSGLEAPHAIRTQRRFDLEVTARYFFEDEPELRVRGPEKQPFFVAMR